MVAFLSDVGDAEAVVKHVRRIRQHHYQGAPLRIGPATKINASDTSLVERLMWYPAAIILWRMETRSKARSIMPRYPNRETFVRMVSLLSKDRLLAAFLEDSMFKTF
jgi:hypothetical protein